jgi:hypothetical protein
MGNPTLVLLQHPPVGPRVDNHLVVALRLCGSIHRVRALLKVLGNHGWRCLRASEEPGSSTITPEEIVMEKSDLEKLRSYAATTRSPMAFAGCAFIKWDYKAGKYLVGKDNVDITGKKLVADVPNAMDGFQRLEKGTKPIYALTKILDATVDPIQRTELGDNDPNRWLDPERDPWVGCTAMPWFDESTRQVFILIATYGGRGEMSNVISAFVDHAVQHSKAGDQLPIVQLCVRQFTKNDGNPGYAMQLDIDGWVDRPAAVLHVQPPPLNITAKADKGNGSAGEANAASKSEASNASKSDSKSDKSPTDAKADAKPKGRKVSVPGAPNVDEDIPF